MLVQSETEQTELLPFIYLHHNSYCRTDFSAFSSLSTTKGLEQFPVSFTAKKIKINDYKAYFFGQVESYRNAKTDIYKLLYFFQTSAKQHALD